MQLNTVLTKYHPQMDPSPLFLSDDEDDQERITRETSASFGSSRNNLGNIRKKKSEKEEAKLAILKGQG